MSGEGVMSTTIDDIVDGSEPPSRSRRSVFGRLYHGETAIDFYGRRWWGLIVSAILVVVTVVSLFATRTPFVVSDRSMTLLSINACCAFCTLTPMSSTLGLLSHRRMRLSRTTTRWNLVPLLA